MIIIKQAEFNMGSWITLTCTREEILNTLKEITPEKKVKEGYFIEKDGKLYRAIRILKLLAKKKLGKEIKSPHSTYQYDEGFKKLGLDLLHISRLVQKGFFIVEDTRAQFAKNSFYSYQGREPFKVKNNRVESKYGTFEYSGYFEFTKNGVMLQDNQKSVSSGVAIVVEQFIMRMPIISFCFPLADIDKFRETMTTISNQLMNWSEQFAQGKQPSLEQMKKAKLDSLPYYDNVMSILDGLAAQEDGSRTVSRVYELFILPVSDNTAEKLANKMLKETNPLWNLIYSIPQTIPKTFLLNIKAGTGTSRIFLVESSRTLKDLKSIIEIAYGLNNSNKDDKGKYFCFKYTCVKADEPFELFRIFKSFNSTLSYHVNKEKLMDIELVDSDNTEYDQLPLCISSEGKYKGKFIDKNTINKKLREL
ncbi:MAG: hypothetical protein R6U52_02920 [Kosmotogaceae bacterium]